MGVVSYTEICNMAYQGSKVIHPRAVELAMQKNIPVRVRSTFSDHLGTLIAHTSEGELQDRPVIGIAHTTGVTQISVMPSSRQDRLQLEIFKTMSDNRISIDFINANPFSAIFTVPDPVAEKAVSLLTQKGYEPNAISNCCKVSVIGAGIAGVPGIMTKIVNALESEGVSILQSADSHTTIWTLVRGIDMEKAICALHDTFELGSSYK
jgi:aspartate kinase